MTILCVMTNERAQSREERAANEEEKRRRVVVKSRFLIARILHSTDHPTRALQTQTDTAHRRWADEGDIRRNRFRFMTRAFPVESVYEKMLIIIHKLLFEFIICVAVSAVLCFREQIFSQFISNIVGLRWLPYSFGIVDLFFSQLITDMIAY